MKRVLLTVFVAGLFACTSQPQETLTRSGLKRADFQTKMDGKKTDLFTLTNARGMEVCITNYGGRIVSVMVPDRQGEMRDVVLGFDSIADYVKHPNNFGSTVGRYANRIAKGRFVLDSDTVQLELNDHGNTLHGGKRGWNNRVFDAVQPDSSTLVLTYVSPDGESNFPGTVHAEVTFKLTDNNAIDISYKATTDKKTVVNMTNHSYFNLSGDPLRPITDHLLWMAADSVVPIDSLAIPLGDPVPVKATPLDFTQSKPIGQGIDSTDCEQIKNGIGYDHNWVLSTGGDVIKPAARLVAPSSGIVLEVFTNEPGLQMYTGNYLSGSQVGKRGVAYPHRSAICLESQHAPDSPNRPSWPSVVLDPGQTYQSRCIYQFSVEE